MPEGQSKWKQDFFDEAEEIRLKDPLTYALGSMEHDEVLVFRFPDVVKMAGHSCPTVSGAYKATAKALKSLYGDEIPVRGDVRVTILGGVDDLAYGPVSQVFTLITGAATDLGFKGIGGRFMRHNLLYFDEDNFEPGIFIFERIDTGEKVKVAFNPQVLPQTPRLGELIPQVISERADEAEKEEFFSLWQGKVKMILLEEDQHPGLFVVTKLPQ